MYLRKDENDPKKKVQEARQNHNSGCEDKNSAGVETLGAPGKHKNSAASLSVGRSSTARGQWAWLFPRMEFSTKHEKKLTKKCLLYRRSLTTQ